VRPASKAERVAFTRGFGMACADLARDHGEDTLAEFLLEGAGYTLADMEAAGMEPYDLVVLTPIFAEIADRARRTQAARRR
jgi:hypothetical protein